MNIKISIIIPIYNSGKYLKKCLDSLRNQTLQEFETICVDDGSEDDSYKILQDIVKLDSRFKAIKKQHEGYGAAAARNEGFKYASGKYVIFLDSDDWFAPSMLERLYARAEETEAEIVFFDGYIYDQKTDELLSENNRITNFTYFPQNDVFSWREIKKIIFQISPGWAWNKLYLRYFVIDNNLYFQNVFHADDAFFSYSSLIFADKITSVRERLIYYRANVPTGQTALMDKSPLSAPMFVMKLREKLKESAIYNELKDSFISLAVSYCGYYLKNLKKSESFYKLYEYLKSDIYPVLLAEDWSDDMNTLESVLQMQQVVKLSALDYLFTRNKYYNDIFQEENSFFPFEDFSRKCKVVIYGAGNYGKSYYMQLMFYNAVDVVGWVDRNYEKLGFPIQPVGHLLDIEFDYVILAIGNKNVADAIKKDLIKLGIKEAKIYWKDTCEINIALINKSL